MVIDMHVHPIFYKSICDNKEELEFRKDTFGVWKQGPMDWDEAFAEIVQTSERFPCSSARMQVMIFVVLAIGRGVSISLP